MLFLLMQRLQQFMIGRYGTDRFNVFLLVCGLVCSLCGSLFFWPMYLLADFCYIYMLFRTLSRNIPKRQRENQAFWRCWRPVENWFRLLKTRFAERKVYKYFKCPNCRQRLRAPRGRGKIEVTCQKCHGVFQTKT